MNRTKYQKLEYDKKTHTVQRKYNWLYGSVSDLRDFVLGLPQDATIELIDEDNWNLDDGYLDTHIQASWREVPTPEEEILINKIAQQNKENAKKGQAKVKEYDRVQLEKLIAKYPALAAGIVATEQEKS